MPIFEGTNPNGWIFCPERFFALNRKGEKEKLKVATISLDGEALAWFQWTDGRRPIRDWPEFKKLLLDQFRSSHEGSNCEKFLALRQEGTVRAYIRDFEMLAAPLTKIPTAILEGNFTNGLMPEK